MLKKLSYLTSVSIIASMAVNPVAQAMEHEFSAERSVKSTSRKNHQEYTSKAPLTKAVSNIIISQPEPETSSLSDEVWINLAKNVKAKEKTFSRISRAVFSGNYDEIMGEGIELLIASLCGKDQALKTLLGKSNQEFDTELLENASNALVNVFLKKLSENKELYGELADGTRVTIYNKSFFKVFAENFFPDVPIVKSAAITFLDSKSLKEYIQKKLVKAVVGYFTTYLENEGISIKQTLGAKTSEFLTAESTIDYKEIWNYLGPHLNYNLRHYIVSLIIDLKNTAISEKEGPVKAVLGTSAFFATAYATSTIAPLIYNYGCYVHDPVLPAVGYLLGSYLGNVVSGLSSAAFVNYGLWHPVKNRMNQWIDNKFSLWALKLIPLSKEEHALYWLNPEAGLIEKGLAYHDYQLRDKLNSESFIKKVLKTISKKSGIHSVLNYCFGKNEHPSASSQEPKYCMFEEEEQAFRRLMLLREENPSEAQKIESNLKKYPPFKQKMSSLQHAQAVLLDDDQGYADSRKQLVKSARGLAAILVKELSAQDENFSASKNDFYTAFLEEIMAFSIKSQDYLLMFVKDERTALKEFFATHIQDENVLSDSPKKTAKYLLAKLMEKCIQQYMNDDLNNEKEKNKYVLAELKSLPLTERMDDVQILYLRKHLVEAQKQSPLMQLHPEILNQIFGYFSIEELIQTSYVSSDLYKLCLDIVDTRKPLIFDIGELNDEENQYHKQHTHDILLIAETYNKLKTEHLAFTLFNIYEEYLKEKNTWKKIHGKK